MTKNREDIKILLLQFRDTILAQQEYKCFLEVGNLKEENLIAFDVINNTLSNDLLDGIDAIIMGGSGDFNVTNGALDPHIPSIKELIHNADSQNIPILGSCLGPQILAHIYDGEVKNLPGKIELGTFKIYKTPEAKDDVLMKDGPQEFMAQIGHKDHVVKLPKGAVRLAYSDLCECQAFKIGDNIYGFQFHMELTKESIIERLKLSYEYGYFDGKEEFDTICNQLQDSEYANSLMEKFIDRVVLKNNI